MKLFKILKKGFTLVELVIVIAVVAILTAVLIPTFSGIIEEAQKSAILQEAIQEYKECYAEDMADGMLDGLTKLDANGQSVPTEAGDGYYVVIEMGQPNALYNKVFKDKYRVVYNGVEWNVYNVGDYQGGGGSGGPSGGGNNNNNNYTAVNMTEKDAKKLFNYNVIQTPTPHIQITKILSTKNKVTVPDTIEEIPVTIMNCRYTASSDIKEISLPRSIVEISEQAFMDFSTLESIYLYEGIEIIGDEAFKGCKNLKSFTVPASVSYIGKSVFSECHKLTTFFVDDKNEHYMDYESAIYTKDETTLVAWPAGNPDKDVELPSKISKIHDGAFAGNEIIKTIEIPESVTVIGEDAFSNCIELINMELPNNLTEVGPGIFSGCKSLSDITVPTIGQGEAIPTAYYLFGKCTEHDDPSVCFSATSTESAQKDCILRMYNNSSVEAWLLGKQTIHISSDCERIEARAFYEYRLLKEIIIPASVEIVAQSAFQRCWYLTDVTFEGPVSFEGWVFAECMRLKTVTLQQGTIFTGNGCFAELFADKNYRLTIAFKGSKAQWEALKNNSTGNSITYIQTENVTVKCNDGDIEYTKNS